MNNIESGKIKEQKGKTKFCIDLNIGKTQAKHAHFSFFSGTNSLPLKTREACDHLNLCRCHLIAD